MELTPLVDADEVLAIAAFVLESDAITGLRNKPDMLIKNIESQMSGRDEKQGHVGALLILNRLAVQSEPTLLTKELICGTQSLIVSKQGNQDSKLELPAEHIGSYRDIMISIGNRWRPLPALVPTLMDQLLSDENFVAWQREAHYQNYSTNIAMVADFHYKFFMLSPFASGNGRTARALSYFLLKTYPPHRPFIFTSQDKHGYYRCFNDNNSTSMRKYFLRKAGYAIPPAI